ncbi:hypothetical protein ACET3Z_024696 [Daucus carota]
MGEVVDGTSASRTLKSKRFSDCLDCCNTDEKNELFSLAIGLSQGEGDDMLDNNCYAPPLIFPLLGNHLAIWLLISSFRRIKKALDLEAPIGNGLFAKDILYHACLGTLQMISFMLEDSHTPNLADMELMLVDQVLKGMGFDNPNEPDEDAAEANKRGRTAANISSPSRMLSIIYCFICCSVLLAIDDVLGVSCNPHGVYL